MQEEGIELLEQEYIEHSKKKRVLKILGRVGVCLLTTVVLLLVGLLGVVHILEFGLTIVARFVFVNSAV